MMTCCCIALGAWSLGIACALFALGFLEGQSDRYANIPWRRELDTCLNWTLTKPRP